MGESSGSSVLILSDSDVVDGAARGEVVLNGASVASEGKVSNENSVDLSVVAGATSSLSGELDVDGSAVQVLLVGGIQSCSGSGMVAILDEGLAL